MLKFFRRIRQRLIDEGNLKKYFIYAIGEIMLIMIGIILALQINNWNSNRIDKINEKVLIGNIIEDLLSDFQTTQSLLNQAKTKQEIHLRLYNESIVNNTVQVENPYSAEIVETTNLFSKAWDNHRESIKKISDSEIRNILNDYFRNYQVLQGYSSTLNEVILNEFRPYLKRNDLINLKAVFESNPSKDDFDRFSFFNHDKLIDKFGTNELNALIVELYLGTQDVIQWLETLMGNNDRLRSLLKAASE